MSCVNEGISARFEIVTDAALHTSWCYSGPRDRLPCYIKPRANGARIIRAPLTLSGKPVQESRRSSPPGTSADPVTRAGGWRSSPGRSGPGDRARTRRVRARTGSDEALAPAARRARTALVAPGSRASRFTAASSRSPPARRVTMQRAAVGAAEMCPVPRREDHRVVGSSSPISVGRASIPGAAEANILSACTCRRARSNRPYRGDLSPRATSPDRRSCALGSCFAHPSCTCRQSRVLRHSLDVAASARGRARHAGACPENSEVVIAGIRLS